MKKFVFLPVVILLLAACSTAEKTPIEEPTNTPIPPTRTSTPVPPTPTETNTPTPTDTPEPTVTSTPTKLPPSSTNECSINSLLEKVKLDIKYDIFEVSYTNFSVVGYPDLSVWYVDPSINSNASNSEIEKNLLLALDKSIDLSHSIINSDECIRELVVGINPVVVDKNFNGWLSIEMPVEAFPNTADLTSINKEEIMSSSIIQYARQAPPEILDETSDDSCSWNEARENIKWHFDPDQPNNSFTFTRDETGTLLSAYWVIPEGFADYALDMSLASVMNVISEAECLYPQVDNFYAFALNNTGGSILLIYMDGESFRNSNFDNLKIYYP